MTITIRNDDTGATREIVTGESGRFHAPNLPPGPYTVTAALTGFQTLSRKNIVLTIGREAVVDFAMGVGQVADVVNVVGEISTVDTTNASTGGLINEEQIKNLPLNGRSFIELANLTPGVQLTNQGGRSTSTGFGQKISVNGSRYTQNLFTLDGTMMNDQFNQAGSASGNMLGVEAVREFQVLTNSFSAEYGRHTGAVINAATKTGTNAFRGSVFEFHRNEALDAKRWEAKQERPAGARLQPQPVRLLGGRADHPEQDVLLRHVRGSARAPRHHRRPIRCRPQRCATPPTRSHVRTSTRFQSLTADSSTPSAPITCARTRETPTSTTLMGRVDHQFSPVNKIFVRYTFNKGEVTNPNRVNSGEITNTKLQFTTIEHQLVRGAGFVNRLQVGMTQSKLDGFDYVLRRHQLPAYDVHRRRSRHRRALASPA